MKSLRAFFACTVLSGTLLVALPGVAETVSSHGVHSHSEQNTTRSHAHGAPRKVVKPPPPPPETLIVIPVTPRYPQRQAPQR